MTLQIRLQELIDETGIKPAHLARSVGCSRASVTDWLNGKTPSMGPELLIKVSQHFGVNELWLLNGIGQKYKANHYNNMGAEPDLSLDHSKNKSGNLTGIDNRSSVSVNLQANSGPQIIRSVHVQSYELWSGDADVEVRGMNIPMSVLLDRGLAASDVVSIAIPDDAQGPRILKNDIACIAIRQDKTAPLKNDKLYAVRFGDGYTLRLISIQSNGDIRLVCSNPSYGHADERVPKDEISQLDILGEYIFGGMPAP